LITYTDDFELIVIDNGSDKEIIDYLKSIKRFKEFRVIFNKKNMGSPYAWDQGIKIAKYDYIAIVDNDVVFSPNWLVYLKECFENKYDCGVSSPTTCFCGGSRCDKEIQNKRFEMIQQDINDYASTLSHGYIDCHIFGFCFLTHRKVIDKIGVFDYKRYGLGVFEERDFFWRAKKSGFRTYMVTHAYIHHYGHTTFKEGNVGISADDLYNINIKKFDDRVNHDKNLFIENDVKV
jgi:GT2 family glycosyltransferase